LEELFHFIDRLQEAPEFQESIKKRCTWDTDKITSLHQLDHQITRAVDFWVNMTLEGYIIEFTVENHQYFSQEEEIFKKHVCDRLLREIPLWIKEFLMEEGMIPIPSTELAI
jgi:hypothetical protein